MSESQYWYDHVRPKLGGFGKLVRVENATQLGTPDVAYVLRWVHRNELSVGSGWIELKHLDHVPKRGGPLRLDHLTIEQVRFIEEWDAAGGRAWLLLRVETHHLLLPPCSVRPLFRGERTLVGLQQEARVWSDFTFPAGRILRALTE